MREMKISCDRAGQPRRRTDTPKRAWGPNIGLIAWYAFLTLAGVLLYRAGSACARWERGSYAVGGEALALLLPLCYYAVETIIRDFVADIMKPPIPAFHRGMPIEVMKDFDAALLFGRLTKTSSVELTIARIPGEECFPITGKGSVVLVRSYDAQMDPILLRAKVIRSSGTECTVGDLEMLSRKARGKRARHPLCPPAAVYAIEDTALSQPQPCRMLNISRVGACIAAEHAYAVGQVLRLAVKPANGGKCASYRCKVVRAAARRDGCFEYGLLFGEWWKRFL